MTIVGIKDNVQALLTDMGVFKDVQAAPQVSDQAQFSGYPSAVHYYNNTESDFATVSQNRRVIEYLVEVYLVTNETDPAIELAKMYELVDQTVQMFDVSRDLSSDSIPLDRACDILRPAAGQLQRVATSEGEGLMATIHLFCESDTSFIA